MNNPERFTKQVTQDEEQENKNTTQYVLGITLSKQTQIYVNKISPVLQTNGGKDEPNIVFMRKS